MKLNKLMSCLMTTMSNPKYVLKMFYLGMETEYTAVMSYNNHDYYPKYLLKMFYWSIEIEYTEVMSYKNHDQSQVFAQNVLLKDRNWIYWGHVLLQPWSIPSISSKCSIQASKLNILGSCLMTTMINPKYFLKMFHSSIEIEYTEVMFYNNHDQSLVFAQNVKFKRRNWMYWGQVWWQPWSFASTCSKSSIQASKLNILRSCLTTTMINRKYLLKMFYSCTKTEYSEVMSYNNHDQSEVFAQNVTLKHRNWICWFHVLWEP